MAKQQLPTTYAQAVEQLNGKRVRKVANNTHLVRVNGSQIGLRLHDTFIIVYGAEGTLTLNSGGYQTTTTKARMNEVLKQLGVSIFSQRSAWYIRGEGVNGPELLRYEDGTVLNLVAVQWEGR